MRTAKNEYKPAVRETGERILNFDKMIEIMKYLGYLVIDQDGSMRDQAREVASTLCKSEPFYGPHLVPQIATAWKKWENDNNVKSTFA